MSSGTISSLLILFLSYSSVLAQTAQTQQVQFNQVLNVNGDMQLNSFQFPDRSKVETFSQKQQQIIVNQQTPAIPANQVTGTTGQPFVQISPQSMTISTNGATDLVGGQIEMVMTMQILQTNAVQPDNTYVAMLSPDRQTWMIQETMRSINTTDMTIRMVKRTQMDGEYMVVGRQTIETNTLVVPFGSDGSTSVAIQGTGLQENEFQDGFRISTRITLPMTMNVDVKKGVDSNMLAALQGQSSVNDYRYSVVSNLAAVTPDLNQQVTVIQMPINPIRIQKMMQTMGVPPTGQVAIGVAQRSVLSNPGGATGNLGGAATQRRHLSRSEFRRQIQAGTPQAGTLQTGTFQAGTPQAGTPQADTPINGNNGQNQAGTPTNGNNPVAAQLLLAPTFTAIQANAVLDQANMRIAVPVPQIDGEFILTMQVMGGVQTAQSQPQPAAQPAPAAPQPAAGAGESQTPTPAAPQQSDKAPAPKPAGEFTPGSAGNSTQTAQPEPKPERRQDSRKDIYGDTKPPQGAIIMSMKDVDTMANAMMWGGSVAVTKMMNEYVKAQTGRDMAPMDKGTAEEGGVKLIV